MGHHKADGDDFKIIGGRAMLRKNQIKITFKFFHKTPNLDKIKVKLILSNPHILFHH